MSKKSDAAFEKIWLAAKAASLKAHAEAIPVPMTVLDASINGQPLPGGKVYHVPEGVCGFAGVVFPANTSFGKWAKRAGIARPSWPSGLHVSTNTGLNGYSQSLERAEAAAYALATALNSAGIKVRVESRMD